MACRPGNAGTHGVGGPPRGAMKSPEELERENAALKERLSRLSEASLRINESLDLDTVLGEVVDSARTLTDARYGGITLLDQSGQFQAFVTSGMTEEERQSLLDLPHGLPLFEFLSSYPEPLRLSDLSEQARFLGVTDGLMPLSTFLGAPIRHRGAQMGNFYLADKKGGLEFTNEDEETLVMFASQAATAIANARQHSEEQRARADLEALVDTSPVGVVVFDARAGRPSSFNREARRIVDLLRTPEQQPEDLLRVMTVRRGDGREVSLQEFPIEDVLRGGENARLEEIVLRVPDGRSITVLMNVTSIRSEHGTRGVGGGHPPGHDTHGGYGASACGVPGDGEPRAACPLDLHQGLGSHPHRGRRFAGPGGGPAVSPDHRRAGGAHAHSHHRPA